MGKRTDDYPIAMPTEVQVNEHLALTQHIHERIHERIHKGPRDPARIERMAAKLAVAWAKAPYLRLGQMVVNLGGTMDPFMVEDDKMEAILDAFIRQGGFAEPKRSRGAKP